MAALDFPSNPTNGQTYENFVYDTSITAWRNQGSPSGLAGQVVALGNSTGLKTIAPSSVVIATGTGSANSLGVVSFSGATAVSLNNVFSSEYKNYKIMVNLTTTVDTLHWFRWRVSGSTVSTGYYGATVETSFTNTGATASQRYNDQPYGFFGYFGTNSAKATLEATPANSYSVYTLASYSTNIGGGWSGGYSATTSTFPDGFTFFPGAGTTSGTVQVFGYND